MSNKLKSVETVEYMGILYQVIRYKSGRLNLVPITQVTQENKSNNKSDNKSDNKSNNKSKTEQKEENKTLPQISPKQLGYYMVKADKNGIVCIKHVKTGAACRTKYKMSELQFCIKSLINEYIGILTDTHEYMLDIITNDLANLVIGTKAEKHTA